MGITGLIPFLEKASSKINIKDLKGFTVAIDTYCWLHKGAYACADKLSRGEDSDIHILYCLKFVNLLLSYNIKPILVFDGRHLPAKSLTESRRRETREQAKKRAAELLRLGRIDEARAQQRRCIDITHEMVLKLIHECRKRNVDCLVAPYEADSQLAYLNQKNIAQYIITEDSDLVLFGCKKIIFKLDLTGNCLLVDAEKLYLTMGCHPEKFTFDKFRQMCILSGCDYLDSLPGIGLAKACKFVLKTEETNMTIALRKIPQYLNMKNLTVTDDYIEEFLKAEATFRHMYVYDPCKRMMVRLTDIPTDIEDYESLCSNAGSLLDDEIAFNLALGNLHPFTLKQLDNWHPDYLNKTSPIKTNSWKTSQKTKHSSIWQLEFKSHVPKVQKKLNAFSFKKINYAFIGEEEPTNNEQQDENESSIVSLYSEHQPPTKKRCSRSKSPDTLENLNFTNNNITDNTKAHNPFAKPLLGNLNTFNSTKTVLEKSPSFSKLERLSKFKRTVIDESKEIKSRFFFSNTILVQNKKKDEAPIENHVNNEEISNTIEEIENMREEAEKKSSSLYSPVKGSDLNESIQSGSDVDDEEEVDLDIKEDTLNSNENINESIKQNIFKNFEYKKKQTDKNCTEKVDNDEIIEVSDSEACIKPTQQKTIRRVGLPKRTLNSKTKNSNSSSQTRLSMFGFKKKPSIK